MVCKNCGYPETPPGRIVTEYGSFPDTDGVREALKVVDAYRGRILLISISSAIACVAFAIAAFSRVPCAPGGF